MIIYSVTQQEYQVREETSDGITYKVVPVVMMVEGVHNGSAGAVYHSAEELGKIPESWNGIPVTVNHPSNDEEGYVSANSPDVLEEYLIGRVFNTFLDGDKLKGEVWFEESKLSEYTDIAQKIDNGEIIEVSVGVFSDEQQVSGTWQDEEYTAIAYNHRPDHLAILPYQTGACSITDGCGLRVNNKNNKDVKEIVTNENQTKVLKELNSKGYIVHISAFEEGLQTIVDTVRTKLYSMDNDNEYYYLEEVFADYLIYRKQDRVNDETKMYKVSYTIAEDDSVVFGDNAVVVTKEVEYVPVSNDLNNNLKVNNMTKNASNCTTCKEKVDALIANELTGYSENQREWLEGLEEGQLDLMQPVIKEKEVVVNAEVTPEIAINALKEGLKTNEDWAGIMPKEMKDQMSFGLSLHNKHKETLVKGIIANAEGVWSEDELNGKDIDELTKLAKLAGYEEQSTQQYYGGQAAGSPQVNTEDEEDVMYPEGVTETKKD